MTTTLIIVVFLLLYIVFMLQKIGDTGTLINPEFASFAKVKIPVAGLSSINVGSSIEITGFDDDGPRFTRATRATTLGA